MGRFPYFFVQARLEVLSVRHPAAFRVQGFAHHDRGVRWAVALVPGPVARPGNRLFSEQGRDVGQQVPAIGGCPRVDR
jgi:hypothetical protein